jgi:hypothetical protein
MRCRREPDVMAYACGGDPGKPFDSRSTTQRNTLINAINPDISGGGRSPLQTSSPFRYSVGISLCSVKSWSSTSYGNKNSQSVCIGSKLNPVCGTMKLSRS